MKKKLIFMWVAYLFGWMLGGVGCKPGTPKYTPQPPDTTYPLVVYKIQSPNLQYGVWKRVKLDSFTWVDQDSSTRKKQWTRFSIYYVPITDTATKLVNYYLVGPDIKIWDMNVNTDSLNKLYLPTLPEVKK